MSSDRAEALIKLELIVAYSSLCLCMTEDPGGTKAGLETRGNNAGFHKSFS